MNKAIGYLGHDGDGRAGQGLGHPVLHHVEHVLVVQQADEVEGPEGGGGPEGQVPDHHRTGGRGATRDIKYIDIIKHRNRYYIMLILYYYIILNI